MSNPDQSAEFRRNATRVFGCFVAALILLLIGMTALGWWIGRWWGLALGATLGSVVFVVGLIGGGMIYAMSQDGG